MIPCTDAFLISDDGHHWTVAAQVRGQATGTSDTLRFAPVPAGSSRYACSPRPVTELTVPAT